MYSFLNLISKKHSWVQQVVLPVLSFYIIIHIFNRIVFSIGNIGLSNIYLLPDISIQIFLAYILCKCSKRYSIFLLIQFTLMSWFYIGSCFKLYILAAKSEAIAASSFFRSSSAKDT